MYTTLVYITLYITYENYMDSEQRPIQNPEVITPELLAKMSYSALLDKTERMINKLDGFSPENVDEAMPIIMDICDLTKYIGFRPDNEKIDRPTLERALLILESTYKAMDQVEQTILRALQFLFPDLTLLQMRDGLFLGQKINSLGFKRGSEERRKYQAMEIMLIDTIHTLRLPSRLPYRISTIKRQLQMIQDTES